MKARQTVCGVLARFQTTWMNVEVVAVLAWHDKMDQAGSCGIQCQGGPRYWRREVPFTISVDCPASLQRIRPTGLQSVDPGRAAPFGVGVWLPTQTCIACRRKEGPRGRTDVMAMLLAARDENDEPMSDDEIRDELITMPVAGHETTATSFSWVVNRLLQNADVLAQAQAEAAPVFGKGMEGSEPTAEQIGAFHYLDAVIKETACLNPSGPNGTGKSTYKEGLAARDYPLGEVINPDAIAAALPGPDATRDARAGRETLRRTPP